MEKEILSQENEIQNEKIEQLVKKFSNILPSEQIEDLRDFLYERYDLICKNLTANLGEKIKNLCEKFQDFEQLENISIAFELDMKNIDQPNFYLQSHKFLIQIVLDEIFSKNKPLIIDSGQQFYRCTNYYYEDGKINFVFGLCSKNQGTDYSYKLELSQFFNNFLLENNIKKGSIQEKLIKELTTSFGEKYENSFIKNLDKNKTTNIALKKNISQENLQILALYICQLIIHFSNSFEGFFTSGMSVKLSENNEKYIIDILLSNKNDMILDNQEKILS